MRTVATLAWASMFADVAERECELRAVVESHGTLPLWAAGEFRPGGLGSDAMASQIVQARAGVLAPRAVRNEVSHLVEREKRELQRRVQDVAMNELTVDWVLLAGQRRFRNVATLSAGTEAAV